MNHITCIRKEYKGRWEGRTPLSPDAVSNLLGQGFEICVERSVTRVFEDEAYVQAGATLIDGGGSKIVVGIKEPPLDIIKQDQIHLCFSHTIKGQPYNMDLLRTFMDRGCTLIDYETMRDETGTRVIAFGRYAGIAGAVDTFYVAGRKHAEHHRAGALAHVEQTWRYGSIEKIKEGLGQLKLDEKHPLRVVIVGTGNVGGGSEEVCQWMGLHKVSPQAVLDGSAEGSWYAVLATQDVVAARDGSPYDKADYRKHGVNKYTSTFERYLGKFDILLQTPYWEDLYPKQLTHEMMLAHKDELPLVIGDISCDIHGSLECTFRESSIDDPAFTYIPERHEIVDGLTWDGPAIMAIGHLPCELALDASLHFARILTQYLPEVIQIDLSKPLLECGLSKLMREATIVYKGELTPKYHYLNQFLK